MWPDFVALSRGWVVPQQVLKHICHGLERCQQTFLFELIVEGLGGDIRPNDVGTNGIERYLLFGKVFPIAAYKADDSAGYQSVSCARLECVDVLFCCRVDGQGRTAVETANGGDTGDCMRVSKHSIFPGLQLLLLPRKPSFGSCFLNCCMAKPTV